MSFMEKEVTSRRREHCPWQIRSIQVCFKTSITNSRALGILWRILNLRVVYLSTSLHSLTSFEYIFSAK